MHGSYAFMRRYFGLSAFMSLSELRVLNATLQYTLFPHTIEDRRHMQSLMRRPEACDIQVVMNAGAMYCDGDYCTKNWTGLYASMRPLFQRLHHSDPFLDLVPSPYVVKQNYHLMVAWHLRTGDISLHKGDTPFFKNIYSSLESASQLASCTLHHFFFWGGQSFAKHISQTPPDGFAFLSTFIPNATYISSNHPEIDLHFFSKADVLVGSGSSFVHAAAFVAPPSLIYIEVPPKESMQLYDAAWGTYHLPNSVIVDLSGNLQGTIHDLGHRMSTIV